jgi:hypothetical protein
VEADGILQLVDPASLDTETVAEWTANQIELEPRRAMALVLAEGSDLWQSYYVRSRQAAVRTLAGYLDRIGTSEAFFLGVGTGREIAYLQRIRQFDRVFCSDLSSAALRLVPVRLEGHALEVGLFTSDLNRCPIACKEVPVVIVRALHHTHDMHDTIEDLLLQGYEHILFEEPVVNWIIHILARRGLAQREEYSGARPGRLSLARLRTMCQEHGYRLSLTTSWSLPEDYYQRVFGPGKRMQGLILGLLNQVSRASNTFKLGNVCVAHLEHIAA